MVSLLISREIEPNVPSPLIKTSTQKLQLSSPSVWQEFTISIVKEKHEGLGLNFSGKNLILLNKND